MEELDDFNRMLAIMETAAHLEVLVERGILSSRTDDGTIRFMSANVS
jgi:hypothetical protein